jgi:hypothetical protein
MTELHDAHSDVSGVPLAILRSLMGGRMQSVVYKTSSNGVDNRDQRADLDVHEVDHAVVISTESASVVLEWCLRNYDEFLNIVGAPEAGVAAAVTDTVDATGFPQWADLRESPVTGFGVATQPAAEDGSELPWALRIDTANGDSVVVALGELRDGIPAYQPDSLLVLFRPELAQSFQIMGSSESAWGRRLPL